MPAKKDLIVIEEVTELILAELVRDDTKKADRPPGANRLVFNYLFVSGTEYPSLTPQNFMDGVGEGRQWPA